MAKKSQPKRCNEMMHPCAATSQPLNDAKRMRQKTDDAPFGVISIIGAMRATRKLGGSSISVPYVVRREAMHIHKKNV